MKQKCFFAALTCLCLAALLPLSACKKTEAASSSPASSSQTAQNWRLGTASPEDAITHLFAVKFAEELARISNNRLKITVYPNSTLGGDIELLESLSAADIQFIVQTTAPAVDFVPSVAVFDLPCLFTSLDELRRAVNNTAFKTAFGNAYLAAGFRVLGVADQGFREMSTNKAIRSFADFRGQKIRTMENKYHLAFWRALGANPTPMAFGEVYTGLQQGTIDGQENPYVVIITGKLYEQQKYVVNTHHLPHLLMLLTNDGFYQSLPDADRKLMDEAAATAAAYAYEQTDARIAGWVKTIQDSGAEMIDLPPALYNEIVAAAQPVYDMIRNQLADKTLVDTLLNARK
jgi:tripartite ATP-independent transporter DctP family solute receptor